MTYLMWLDRKKSIRLIIGKPKKKTWRPSSTTSGGRQVHKPHESKHRNISIKTPPPSAPVSDIIRTKWNGLIATPYFAWKNLLTLRGFSLKDNVITILSIPSTFSCTLRMLKVWKHENVLPQSSGRPRFFRRINEMSFRIKNWSLRIISRNFLI